jgi:DNA polymerase-3 subunit beta
MKAICDRSALLEAVNALGAVVVTRTPKPILMCIKIAADEERLTLSSTDLEIALQLTVDQVDVTEPGEAVILADKLQQILRESSDATVTIETDGHDTHIKAVDAHFKVLGYPAGDYPPVPEFPGDDRVIMELKADTLIGLVSRTVFATARENSRYAINGVLMSQSKKKLELVATDGRRLAISRGECTPGAAADDDVKAIIPTKALSVLTKLLHDPGSPIRVAITENQALFSIGGNGEPDAILSSNLVEGAFPPYEDVIPKDQDKRVSFPVDALSSAVRRAALLTNEESRGVRFAFQGDALTLSSRAPEIGEAEIRVDMEGYSGDEIEIGFNPTYVLDVLKVAHAPEIEIELKAPAKPGVLRIGNEFVCVIMPVSL